MHVENEDEKNNSGIKPENHILTHKSRVCKKKSI